MAHFDIPLDLQHAGRIADRIVDFLGHGDAVGPLEIAERLSNYLFRNLDDPDPYRVRDEAAQMGRALVDALEASSIANDRLGQHVRNLFECLELGEEGAVISLRAGENPNSIQRPT